MNILYPILAGLAIMLVSLSGVITTWRTIGLWMQKNLHYLISFAAGVFFIVAFGLSEEVFELVSVQNALIYIIIGFVLFVLFEKLFPESHHHHEESCDHDPKPINSTKVLWADALHNIADGILLVPAFFISFELGLAVSIGILIHEFIQEVSEFFVLKEAGLTTKQALIRNFAVSSTILIGIAISFFLSQVGGLEPLLLGIAAGGFFYVVFVDLIPHSLSACGGSKGYAAHILWGIIGALVMIGVNTAFADTHVHGGEIHDHDHAHEEEHDEHAREENHGHEGHHHDHH